MKITVVRASDGAHETITLVPPVTVTLGEYLNVLHDSAGIGAGMDHYFHPDGRYDGWGRAFSEGEKITLDEAVETIQQIEDSREIEQ